MSEVIVEVTNDGPYKVSGPLSLRDHAGSALAAPGAAAIFLCRCGGSANKPFCDGTHAKIGFDGAAPGAPAEVVADADA